MMYFCCYKITIVVGFVSFFRAPGLPPSILPAGRKPPGPPPGPPPELSDSDGEEVSQEAARQRKIRFADVDTPSRKEDAEYANRLQAARQDYDKRRHEMMLYYEQVKLAERVKASDIPLPKLPQSQLGFITSDIPLPAAFGSSVPPSQIPLPPPTVLPTFTGLIRPGFPGAPQPNQARFMFQSPGATVLSAPPSLHPRDPLDNADLMNATASLSVSSNTTGVIATGTTIEAKPQLKNLIGDATRFVPTALKVRRTTRDPSGRLITVGGAVGSGASSTLGKFAGAVYDRIGRADGTGNSGAAAAAASKDDAYEEFMREMEGLL
ncbi:hypothetical protein AHF37_05685 [Paragonimus kellicotti]|nr:hypothetical protein AHF37_05685 [Paragonimus kellicotti]